jgi:hypothetical protein
MANDNVTPITAAGKPNTVMAERIEEQRIRIFRAMNFVWTTELSLGEDNLDQRGTLEAAYEVLNEVVLELNALSGQ